jgi:hypothetical protein
VVDIHTIGDELYGLLPGEFTQARNAQIRTARNAGNRELAEALAQLRRPTAGAWLANQLARERKEQLGALLDLGKSMRKAQEVGDGPELRRLSRLRHQMMTALVSEAKVLARTRNQSIGENTGHELEHTLEAGVANAEAAEHLRSGRLSNGLTYSGFGPLEGLPLTNSTSSPPRSRSEPRSPEGSGSGKGKSGRGLSNKQQVRHLELEAALAEADRTMKRAQELVNVNRKELGDAREERDQLRKRLVEAQRHVRDTKKSLDRAEQRLAQSEQAEKMSRREAARAKTQRRQAETLLGKATWAE